MKRYIRSETELDVEQRKEIAKNSTSAKDLERLATDEYYMVRANVAQNPNTPLDILTHLAQDEYFLVRAYVAKNINSTADLLMNLAQDSLDSVRYYVACNPNTPTEVLKQLAQDKDEDVREVAAKQLRGNKSNRAFRWKSLIQSLQSDYASGVRDPLYEMTDAGENLREICQSVEDRLGLCLIPSIQGGRGGIWIYNTEDDSLLAEDIDYADFNLDTLDMAASSSSKKEFIAKYTEYLQSLV